MRGGGKGAGQFKHRIRQLTRRSGGTQPGAVVDKLRPYMLGWKAYFGLAQTPGSGASWTNGCATDCGRSSSGSGSTGTTIYREIRALGARMWCVAGNSRPLVAQQRPAVNSVLTIAYFDRLGVTTARPNLNFSNRPVRTRMPGGVAGVRPIRSRPLCRLDVRRALSDVRGRNSCRTQTNFLTANDISPRSRSGPPLPTRGVLSVQDREKT